MIELNHLTKKYGKHVAVDDLSLKMESGKIYGFLGPNGAGKSTTMNMITGYIGATSGEIKIGGIDIFEDPEKARMKIGYLPELPPVYPDMTVREYLYFAAALKKIDKKERIDAAAEVMELTKITDVEGRLIKNLSKGYKQRVGLAQAILGFPEVIILDEPMVGLDPKQIVEIRDLIRHLGENHTVILSSHIMQEVSAVCDYIFIISKGKLVAADTTENLSRQGNQRKVLELVIKGEEGKIRTMLKAFPDAKISSFEETENECHRLQLSFYEEIDFRERLFYTCADQKLAILEMNFKEHSLEDIFLELTESGKTAEAMTESAEEEEENNDCDL